MNALLASNIAAAFLTYELLLGFNGKGLKSCATLGPLVTMFVIVDTINCACVP